MHPNHFNPAFTAVNLNPGSFTIYQNTLNDARRTLVRKAIDKANAAGGSHANQRRVYREEFKGRELYKNIQEFEKERAEEEAKGGGDAKNLAKFLQTLGIMAAGRGVNKALMTPAQLNGLNPQNPEFFGMQPKQPVPYQKIIAEKQNLESVLKGYQEHTDDNGPSAQDAANIIANIKRHHSILQDVYDKKKKTSIYAGVPKSTAHNLYEINMKNQRENSIYALQ